MPTAEKDQPRYSIVVGFDGSEGSAAAMRWAVAEAERRDAEITAVRAWSTGEYGTLDEMAEIAQKTLDADVAAIVGDVAGARVATVAERGPAAKVLLRNSHDADMVVVGSRGHGGFTGLLLGSVGQQVATHAGAPVVVIIRG